MGQQKVRRRPERSAAACPSMTVGSTRAVGPHPEELASSSGLIAPGQVRYGRPVAPLSRGSGEVGRSVTARPPSQGSPSAPAPRKLSRRQGPGLSVVVPAYHEGDGIQASLARLATALDGTGTTWEVVVVVDGDPATLEAARHCQSDQIRVVGYGPNRGKGFALRYGLAQTRGEVVTIIDADMEIAPEEIGRMVALLHLYQADIVVGSKRHPLSQVTYPWLRRVQSSAYQFLLRALFQFNVRDTQTGLKVMRREVATRVVDVALVKRFAFDVELLALARHFGYLRVMEAPVRIDYAFQTTTSLGAAARVLWDTAAIFYRLRLRHWYDRNATGGRQALDAGLADSMTSDC
jgi:glycosyltransferase involved in cell wall biosynthesis